jgi:hypothetical protein
MTLLRRFAGWFRPCRVSTGSPSSEDGAPCNESSGRGDSSGEGEASGGRKALGDEEPSGEEEAEKPLGEETVIDLGAADTIDLHTFRPREVPSVVAEFLNAAVEAGITQVRIIHGKGIGVQRRIVRQVLAADPRVSWFADAPDASGWGATVARLDPQPGKTSPEE